MPDENRFARLGDEIEDPEETDDSEPDSTGDAATEQSDPDDPAFAFEQTIQRSMYIREPTETVLEDLEFEVESLLRTEHEMRNLTGREFMDALIHTAAESPDNIADLIAERREENIE